jgi:hypothetical protein
MGLCETCKKIGYCKDALCRDVEGADIVECNDYDEIPEQPKKKWFGLLR